MLRGVFKSFGRQMRRFSSSSPNPLNDLEKRVTDLEHKVKERDTEVSNLAGISFGLILGVLYLAGTKKENK